MPPPTGGRWRQSLVRALGQSIRADITWIEQLMAVGEELRGVDLPETTDEGAAAADLRTV